MKTIKELVKNNEFDEYKNQIIDALMYFIPKQINVQEEFMKYIKYRVEFENKVENYLKLNENIKNFKSC